MNFPGCFQCFWHVDRGLFEGYNSFSAGFGPERKARGRLGLQRDDLEIDFHSTLEVDLSGGLGTGVQRDSFGFSSHSVGLRRSSGGP